MLRVDGHTDVRPIASAQFPSNWELSAARAISVVQYLISRGVSPQRLVAAGFGEFQPLDPGADRRGLSPQPPHRAEADRAVSEDGRRGFGPIPRPTRTRRSRSGCAPGSRPIRTSISRARLTGGASAGATNWCRRRGSSSREDAGTDDRLRHGRSANASISIRSWWRRKPGAPARQKRCSPKRGGCRPTASICTSIRTMTARSASTRSTALPITGEDKQLRSGAADSTG